MRSFWLGERGRSDSCPTPGSPGGAGEDFERMAVGEACLVLADFGEHACAEPHSQAGKAGPIGASG